MAAQTKARFIIVGRSALTTVEDESADIRSITDEGDLRAVLIAARRLENAEMIPAEIERDLQRILKDRAVRENLDAIRASGATVEYHSLNVRDDDAFAVLIDDIYERFGRIDGVLHGAGVIEDGWLRNKDADSFARVFETKVNSALLMAHRLRPENLRFMVFFSSISGRFGNLGQVDYAAANECLNKLADHLDREWPGRIVSINWGPWDAGMISDGLRQAYQERGIKLIPIEQGVEALIGELCRESSQVPEVVLTCSTHEFAPIV
jgi:NAD(P)-dependent dehydrogenase (short-subunit alcohol dehydrogenase family)